MPDASSAATLPVDRDNPEYRRYTELEDKYRSYRPGVNVDLLPRAFSFAAEQHRGQKRKTGEPYVAHPLEVAHLLAEMRLDESTLAGGLLHDTIEDTPATLAQIRREFGPELAACINGVTKIGRLRYRSSEARQAETFRKMVLAMSKDIRVILIKLADRLHNMRTLAALDMDRQKRIALETREIYAPVALRLGMGKVRSELEDLAFRYLEPHAYQSVVRQVESRRESSEEFLAQIQRILEEKLTRNGIPARVEGRIKRPYSIHQKLERQKVSFDMVHDLLALRVITNTKTHCYAAMGVIHGQWHPVPGRIKDFVAMPRPNLYQSLHTTVVTHEGQRFEVQIRTEEMHTNAEEGICAHWMYKERQNRSDVAEGQVAWLRRLVEWQREVKDSTDFLSTLKIDLYKEEVYVFTPRGKVISLPREATPVDFAYAIHTEVGHTCVGARVDGQIAPIRRPLQNGEIVEVLTKPDSHPKQDWLSFVKTSRARNKIKQWLNAERRRSAIEIGRRLLEKEARAAKVALGPADSDRLVAVCREYGCRTADDLYARLGFGRYSVAQVVRKLSPTESVPDPSELRRKPPVPEAGDARKRSTEDLTLEVRGVDDVLIYRARCCNPIPGEEISGYVTRGKGVAVHSKSCSNVQNLMFESERRIDVSWAPKSDSRYQARLTVKVDDRRGVLNDLTSIVANAGLNIVEMGSKVRPTRGTAQVDFIVEVKDKSQLESIVESLSEIDAVMDVSRASRI